MMMITARSLYINDEIMARLIPGCFDPKPGVTIEEVREHLQETIAQRAQLNENGELRSWIGVGGKITRLELYPLSFSVLIDEHQQPALYKATTMYPNGDITVHHTHKKLSLDKMQKEVGGYIIRVSTLDKRHMLVDMDGLRKKLEPNEQASLLCGYSIVGPALVLDYVWD